MSISENEVREIIQKGENDQIEFKTSLRDTSTLVQNITAFSNVHGGTILVGVDNSHNIIGANPDEIIQIVESSKPMFMPAINFDVNTIEIDNKQIVAITVPESKEMVLGEGMALKRVGDRNQPLSPREILSKLSAVTDPNQIGKLADSISRQTQTIERQTATIEQQTKTIDQQTKTIAKLNDDLQKAGSLPSKLKEWLISGVIGAILGILATKLVGM